MPDGSEKKQEEATAEQGTLPSVNAEYGDDALNRAAESAKEEEPAKDSAEEEVAEEEVEEVKEKEPAKEEVEEKKEADPVVEEEDEAKEDHKERTRLGRKVAKHDEMMAAIAQQNAQLLEVISKLVPKAEAEETKEEEPFEGFATQADLDAYLDKRERKKADLANAETVKYQTGYLDAVNSWTEQAKEEDDPDVAEVYKLLVDESEGQQFNVRHSSNPKADFALNLARAQANYYKTKAKGTAPKKSPLKNDPAKAPLGVAGATKTDVEKSKKTVKLDPEALAFIKASGISEEKAVEYLSSPAPMHMKRGI
jgi:hypothetical protein